MIVLKKISLYIGNVLSIILLIVLYSEQTYCQDYTSGQPSAFIHDRGNEMDRLAQKYNRVGEQIEDRTDKSLRRMQKMEAKLQKQVAAKDSSKSKRLFAGSQEKYAQLKTGFVQYSSSLSARKFPLREYMPGVDSMQTAIAFLQQKGNISSPDQIQKIQNLQTKLKLLQGKMQASSEIQDYLKQREAILNNQLGPMNLTKSLVSINKEIYYYQQQIAAYKQLVQDLGKLGQTVLTCASRFPAFQHFLNKNSYLSSLFPLAGEQSDTTVVLSGLQTKSQVQQRMAQQAGSPPDKPGVNEANGQKLMQQGLQKGQAQLSTMQNSVNQIFNGGSSSMVMPDFSPNHQKTKSLMQRIQLGWSMESEAGLGVLPNTVNFGVTAGYKISDSKVIGIGGSYILGTGNGIDHIQLNNQGIGLRSFADIRAKKRFWITAGWEYNYMMAFSNLRSLPGINLWQKSALLGLTKKYNIGRKEGNLQLLYDFLANENIPRSRSLKFRMGYTF